MDEVLKSLAQTFSKLPTREEFAKAFKLAMDTIAQSELKLFQRLDARLEGIRSGTDGKDGRDGKDGKDGPPGPKGDRGDTGPIGKTFIALRGAKGAPGKDGSPDTPTEVRDKLETLEGEERLDKSAVKGIEQLEEQLQVLEARPLMKGGTPVGVRLYVNGGKKGLVQYINLIAGSNITLTHNVASGRNDITISATGGGSGAFTVLTATGTIDDSNAVFTFASTPTLVIVNGNAYRDGAGASISGTTVTLDSPVGAGGDIYALA